MKTHPHSRARRRELARQYAEPKDAFGHVLKPKDPYSPNPLSTPYCPDSKKEKLQFASETTALHYIQYNSDKIKNLNGYAPIRAYYCKACGCWHVTSKKLKKFVENPT